MLNQKLKINTKIFNEDVEKKSTRQGFGEGLLQAGIENENVVGLCADLTESTKMNLFAEKFPERFIQVGVAEQNLASVASGMSAMGKIPSESTFTRAFAALCWMRLCTTGGPRLLLGVRQCPWQRRSCFPCCGGAVPLSWRAAGCTSGRAIPASG